ncbi:MAG: prepilin-type N-terminal cleavage/methylation domain-containing protein [bacterium]|nr:prepilin-type N-terminal cleavage/methylation domain-containing protein [bacterium]
MAITPYPFSNGRELFSKNDSGPMQKFRKSNGRGFFRRTGKGFSLIELLVVTAILVVVTSLTLANNSRFGGVVLLQNLAYDIALSIRQAQVYGISVRNVGAGNFNALYGMHFDVNDQTHYELFADTSFPPSGIYTSEGNIYPSPYAIGRGYKIAYLCAPAGIDSSSCTQVPQLDIVFQRPEPDARITAGDGTVQTCIQNPIQCQQNARIVVKSPRGDIMSILVEATGQISVQK